MIPERYTVNAQYRNHLLFALVYEWDVPGEAEPMRRMAMTMHESAARAKQTGDVHVAREKSFGNDVRYYVVPVSVLDPRKCPDPLFPPLPPEAANISREVDALFGRT